MITFLFKIVRILIYFKNSDLKNFLNCLSLNASKFKFNFQRFNLTNYKIGSTCFITALYLQ